MSNAIQKCVESFFGQKRKSFQPSFLPLKFLCSDKLTSCVLNGGDPVVRSK